MSESKNGIKNALRFPLVFVGVIWIIKILDVFLGLDFTNWGVWPRHIEGLRGILLYPLLHGDAHEKGYQLFQDFDHVFSNSVPLLVLGSITFLSFRKVAWKVWAFIWVVSGTALWFFARGSIHIGASGLVYGLAFFVFFSGVFRRDVKSIALALLVAFFYGGLIWGVLPLQQHISWEGHLFGGLAGAFMAWFYKDVGVERTHYSWMNDRDEDPGNVIEKPFWVKDEPLENKTISNPIDAKADNKAAAQKALEEMKIKYHITSKKPPKDQS